MAIFTMLIHEHGRAFHLLISSPISFVKDLKFLSCISFTCLELLHLVIVIPKYILLFDVIVKDIDSLMLLCVFSLLWNLLL